MFRLAAVHLSFNKLHRGLLLDLGCGREHQALQVCSSDQVQAVGIDINLESLRYARSHHPQTFYVCGSIEELPFRDATFEAVFSLSVLQYVDWRRVISQCERLLKPGGRAVFIENLADSPLARIYRSIHRRLRWKYAPYQTPRSHMEWRELGDVKKYFEAVEFSPFHLTTPAALAIPALQQGLYKRPMHVQSQSMYRALNRLDSLLLKGFPRLGRYCWRVVIRATKGARKG